MVTKLTRDVSSSTASQDVNFWLRFERALEGIEAQFRSEEVRMVMDALRNAKRFHGSVGFIAETRLKEATDLGGSFSFFFGINEADGYTSATSWSKRSLLLCDLDKGHESLTLIENKNANCLPAQFVELFHLLKILIGRRPSADLNISD